jgi:GntR family transcriptional regulator
MAALERRPLTTQVRDQILHMVQQGHLQAGDRLPTEFELASHFQVSRATIREALKLLDQERIILCRHGVGRFVAPGSAGVFTDAISNLKSVTEMARDLHITISTQVISLREEIPDLDVREKLALQPGMAVVSLERVRYAEGEPVIYSTDVFPRQIVTGPINEAAFQGSLCAIMEDEWNVRLEYSRSIVRAALLDPELCRRINVPDCLAWLSMEQINYDAQDRPVLYSIDYHRGDKFEFQVIRQRRG